MFKIKWKDSRIFKKICDFINRVGDMVIIKIDLEKLIFDGWNISRSSHYLIEISKEFFEEFHSDGEYILIIQTESLIKILRRANDETCVLISSNSEGIRNISIEFIEKENLERNFKLYPISDPDYTFQGSIEETNFENMLEISNQLLEKIILDCDIFAEIFNINFAKTEIVFSAIGHLGETKIPIILENYKKPFLIVKEMEQDYLISHYKKISNLKLINEDININISSKGMIKLLITIQDYIKIEYDISSYII